MIKGIAASNGVAIGKVYKLEQPNIVIKEKAGTVDEESKIFKDALAKTIADIEKVKERASANLSAEELAIFDAHLMMANDPEYSNQISDMIQSGSSASQACKSVSDMMISMFSSMEDAYFKERAADIKDVSYRLLCNILGLTIPDLTTIDEEVIIVANDLTPSDTAQLNKKYTLGFITEIGGRTSHSAIMARSLEIPAVVGCAGIMSSCKTGDVIVMDAVKGNVYEKPTPEDISHFTKKREKFLEEKAALKVLINEKTISTDGVQVELAGNIGTPKDVQGVLDNGGEGIGLYRTEFLYMDSKDGFPSEDVQFEAYKAVLKGMNGRKVVVRTLDIGGDKKLNYFTFPEEMNPFLGYRAIRLCLDRKDIFKTQIRALLRASIYGKLCIMFPMIATVNEFKEARQLVLTTKDELIKEGVKVSDSIQIGMMVEIPAAAVLADEFAKYADFFSIGTNDLVQYSMAADRMSEKVSYLYQPLNPSLLRLIKMTIDGAHSKGKWCGMCGEMAGDELAAPVLLGLGLDEFSMSATSILPARKMINSLSKKEMEDLSSKAIALDRQEDVIDLVTRTIEHKKKKAQKK